MPLTGKQHPPSTKKVALRALPTDNIMPEAQSTPLTKRKRPFSEPVNVSGARRHYPDRPPSPLHQSTPYVGPTNELLPKANAEVKVEEMVSPESSQVPENSPALSLGSPVFSPSSKIYWKDRFVMLQKFLNQCDQADQEDYIQMLRSSSAAARSKHAVELEKRAIHLLLEEGKELRRMKLLNVLGKPSTN